MKRFEFYRRRSASMVTLSAVAFALVIVSSLGVPAHAGTVTFGSGANQFNMEFVTIGNPGNAADTDANALPLNAGAVGYTYDIGKFEVSEGMIAKYNANFGTANGLVISTTTRGPDKPAANITWNEAARFVNWLNTSTGNQPAYKFAVGSDINANIDLWAPGEAGYDSSNRYRNSLAKYFLPNSNEWYKAAYYNPSNSTYYDFANGSDTAPLSVTGGTSDNTAVYQADDLSFTQTGPADVTNAGGLSPYGVMGLNGNIREWEESSFDLLNSAGSSNRARRGGSFGSFSFDLKSSSRITGAPNNTGNITGFRVAGLPSSAPVPEPTSMAIFGLGAMGMAYRARRRIKA